MQWRWRQLVADLAAQKLFETMEWHHMRDQEQKDREPNLGDWKHQEGSTAAHFQDDGNELGVDGTQRAVPRHTGHPHIVDAVLRPPRLAKDMTELALPDEGHVWRQKCKEELLLLGVDCVLGVWQLQPSSLCSHFVLWLFGRQKVWAFHQLHKYAFSEKNGGKF